MAMAKNLPLGGDDSREVGELTPPDQAFVDILVICGGLVVAVVSFFFLRKPFRRFIQRLSHSKV